MSNPQQILALLADGRFHSGEDLGRALGVSRAAVWKQLARLRTAGVPLQAVRGRGYRLPEPLELLSAATIRGRLSAAARARLDRLEVLQETDSTNAWLRRHRTPGQTWACRADRQTAGRGRRGRAWVSPFAGNLYLSLGWRFEGGPAALGPLSLVAGAATAEAIEAETGVAVGLKWPNDLYIGDRKLGGLLVELAGEPAGPCDIVLGVGINLHMPAAAARDIDQPWTDLGRHAATRPGRNRLAVAVLEALLQALPMVGAGDAGHWLAVWRQRDCLRDRSVRVYEGEQVREGIARGIDDQGALLLEEQQGLRPVAAGEVSIRVTE